MRVTYVRVEQREQGFTLLEVLIAIVITALIGLGTSQLLSGTIKAQEITQKNSERFEQIQKAVLLLSRDIQQINTRSIRDEYGDYQPALTNRNSLYFFELTRSGWRNPMADERSELQRVSYELVDGELLRHYWHVLDRSQDSESVFQTLLTDIDKITLRFMSENSQWVESWPPEQDPDDDNPRARNHKLPKAVELTIIHEFYGEITKLYDLPQYVSIVSTAQDDKGESGEGETKNEESSKNEDADSK